MNIKKTKIIGYIRVSSEKQTLQNQRLAIYDYARKNNLQIESFTEITISSRRDIAERRILSTLSNMSEGDTLIVSELSRLGRSTIEVLTLTKQIVDRGIKVITIKENILLDRNNNKNPFSKVMLTFFTILAELERDLISQRTKEGLALRKSQGVVLGKPKGTVQKSLYDPHQKVIINCLRKKMNITNISRFIQIGKARSLQDYVNSRKLKEFKDV